MLIAPELEQKLEASTVALNHWLYAQSAGLPVEPDGYEAPATRLADLYAGLLDSPNATVQQWALENWAGCRQSAADQQVTAAMDESLHVPDLRFEEGALNWRNWKAFERSTTDPQRLTAAFEILVDRSTAVEPLLQTRLDATRRDFALYGQTPWHTFSSREGIDPFDLAETLREVGRASRATFEAALHDLSRAVFQRPAGPVELRALYLNRMYEPHAGLFSPTQAASDVQRAFEAMGFDLSHIPVDTEDRPRKYAGAFCFPIMIPQDVRVSVRQASAHHLVDMLYHEFGHAAHFSGIDANLSFLDRYWLHSGLHETFSTLFESLLEEPLFLAQQFGLSEQSQADLVNFGRFKRLLTCTWLCAAALTSADAWLEELTWPAIEQRYAVHVLAFTGIAMPPGYARLDPFVQAASVYPAGYVIAAVRVANWQRHLRHICGPAWWHSASAQTEIKQRMAAGGQAHFPAGWNDPAAMLGRL
jgi:hypothetical protein